jgi:hypothetical protein
MDDSMRAFKKFLTRVRCERARAERLRREGDEVRARIVETTWMQALRKARHDLTKKIDRISTERRLAWN